MGYLYIALTILFTVYGQLIMKYEVGNASTTLSNTSAVQFYIEFLLRPLVMSGFAAAVLASLAWIAALSKFELSYAYPFMSLNFIFVGVLSFMLFGESVNMHKLAGILVICSGLVLLGLGEKISNG